MPLFVVALRVLFTGGDGLAVRVLDYWPKGQRFKPQFHEAAIAGPLRKAPNPLWLKGAVLRLTLHSDPNLRTIWDMRR